MVEAYLPHWPFPLRSITDTTLTHSHRGNYLVGNYTHKSVPNDFIFVWREAFLPFGAGHLFRDNIALGGTAAAAEESNLLSPLVTANRFFCAMASDIPSANSHCPSVLDERTEEHDGGLLEDTFHRSDCVNPPTDNEVLSIGACHC